MSYQKQISVHLDENIIDTLEQTPHIYVSDSKEHRSTEPHGFAADVD